MPSPEGGEAIRDAELTCDQLNRLFRLLAYFGELMRGGPNAPSRPDIPFLGEASLLRIEAGVLEIMVKMREWVQITNIPILVTEEEVVSYARNVNWDTYTAARQLTDQMFWDHLVLPIFRLVADECLVTVGLANMPLCLESAGQFAVAHVPPDEDFVPRLRLKEFKLYQAKALRRDAERVGSKTSGGGQPKPDGDHQAAPAGNTSNE